MQGLKFCLERPKWSLECVKLGNRMVRLIVGELLGLSDGEFPHFTHMLCDLPGGEWSPRGCRERSEPAKALTQEAPSPE